MPEPEPTSDETPAVPTPKAAPWWSGPRDRLRAVGAWLKTRRARIGFTAGGIVLAVLALVGGGVGLGWWAATEIAASQAAPPGPEQVEVPVGTFVGDDVLMPDVRGLTPDEAMQVLADAGIDVESVTVSERPAAGDSGLVIEQTPAFGTAAPSKIALVVSAPAAVPDIAGMSIDDALDILNELGAQVEQVGVFDPAAKLDQVVSVKPAAGEPLPAVVTVTVTEAASSVNLANLQFSGDCRSDSSVLVGGKERDLVVHCSSGSQVRNTTWGFGNAVALVNGSVGIPDDDSEPATVRVEFFGDGKKIAGYDVAPGKIVPIALKTTGVGVLTLRITGSESARSDLAFFDFVAQGSSSGISGLARR